MLSYPVRLIPTSAGVRASFPDVPEASAEGASEEDALNRSKYVLEMVLARYVMGGRPIPAPSDICGAPLIETDKFGLAGDDPAARQDDELERTAPQSA